MVNAIAILDITGLTMSVNLVDKMKVTTDIHANVWMDLLLMLMEYVLNPTLSLLATLMKDSIHLLELVFVLMELNILMENVKLLFLALQMLNTMELFVFAKLDLN
jgi:hypothetical protein